MPAQLGANKAPLDPHAFLILL